MALLSGPNYKQAANKYAFQAGIDPAIFSKQIMQESGFDPAARSSAGAIGIAQIVPKYHPGIDATNPMQSLQWAANYDASLLGKYGGDWRKVLSVYNSGQPDRYTDPNFAHGQTFNYVNSILGPNYTPKVLAHSPAGTVGTVPTTDGKNVPFVVEGRATPQAAGAIKLAQKYLGTPYVYGGETPAGGFDCSGLLQYVWAKQGITIPRRTYEQYTSGMPVASNKLQPGDAVFFTGSDPLNGLPGHVGMYIGGGKFIESPHTGASIRISNMAGRTDFVGARRYGPSANLNLVDYTVGAGGTAAASTAPTTVVPAASNVLAKPTVIYQAPRQTSGVQQGGVSLKKKAAAPSNTGLAQILALLKQIGKPQPQQDYSQSATAYANQALNASINPLLAAQAQARSAGTANAASINQAALAASQFLAGLEDKARSDYQAISGEQRQTAQGYTGVLHDTATQAADQLQAALGTVPGNQYQVVDQSQNLADLLRGTSDLQGNTLAAQGALSMATAHAIPQATIAYGQDQARTALGTAEQAAQQYNLPIAQATAQFPKLMSDYMTQLSTAAATARQRDITNALNIARLYKTTLGSTAALRPMNVPGVGLVTFDAAGNPSVAIKAAQKPGDMIPKFFNLPDKSYIEWNPVTQKMTHFPAGYVPDKVQSVGGGAYTTTNQSTGEIVYHPGPGKPPVTHVIGTRLVDDAGHVIANFPADQKPGKVIQVKGVGDFEYKNGGWVFIKGTKPKATPGTGRIGGLTGNEWDTKVTNLQNAAIGWAKGTDPTYSRNPKTNEWEQQPGTGITKTPYRDALQMALDQGSEFTGAARKKWIKAATDTINGVYKVPRTTKDQVAAVQKLYANWRSTGGLDKSRVDPTTGQNPYVPLTALAEAMWMSGIPMAVIARVLPVGRTGGPGVISQADLDAISRGHPLATQPTGTEPGAPWTPSKDRVVQPIGHDQALTKSGHIVNLKTRTYAEKPNQPGW